VTNIGRAAGGLRRALVIVLGIAVVALPAVAAAGAPAAGKSAAAKPVKTSGTPVGRKATAGPVKRPAAATASRSRQSAKSVAQRRPTQPVAVSARRAEPASVAVPQRVSIGQAIGLHLVDDPLDLKSSVALVVDQESGETLFQKNPKAVLPIASITKLMTAIVVLDAGLPLDEMLTVTEADRDTERHSSSRLQVGAQLSRRDMLQLALMASENRAASALGRSYPGGPAVFVAAMNQKARELRMVDSRFADPTGLSGHNVSNARDLATLVRTAYEYPLVREFSTAPGLNVETGPRRVVAFRTTNRLVDATDWDIGLQKTGYISEAGRCLVMQATIDGRGVVIVLLDAAGTHYRMADAQRIRAWLRSQPRPTTAEVEATDRPDAGRQS
jgi:serine-type D-Ala-D-Ala endopeptidase (penicillin-binding protein 7)